jgi:ribosomal RNA-processing protein 8
VLSYDLVGDVSYLAPTAEPRTTARGWVVPGDFLESVPLPGEPGGDEHAQDGFKAAPVVEGKKKGKKQVKTVARVAAPQVVDTVVCCLSLMGVNWVGGIYEAARILKTG